MSSAGHSESGASRSASKRFTRIVFLLLLGMILVGVCVAFFQKQPKPGPDAKSIDGMLTRGAAAFEARELLTARRLADRVLEHEPRNPPALLLVAKCLEAEGSVNRAAEAYAQVPSGHPPHSTEAAWRRGHVMLLKLRRPWEAEQSYLRALKDEPDSLPANTGLTLLYGFSRQWRLQIRTELVIIRSGRFEPTDLFSLAKAADARDDSFNAKVLWQSAPEDPLVRLSMARAAMDNQKYSDAISILEKTVLDSPDRVQAQVWLGELYLETGKTAEFASWSRRVPDAVNRHPTAWALRGQWARQHATAESALRCFCEAIQRDPNQIEALYQAGRILTELNREEDAAPFLKRARRLQEYVTKATIATSNDSDVLRAARKRSAELAEALGNTWEAFGWAWLARSHPQDASWAQEIIARLHPRLAKLPLQRTEARSNPVRDFPFRSLPLPSISPETESMRAEPAEKALDRFSFADRAATAGISFRYFNGSHTVEKGTKYLYETNGGGIGVIDINGDLLPDLYFTEGCDWPVDENRFDHLDRVYLNLGNGRFTDVTETCGIRENRFSQGVAVGDLDSDGFPDLAIGNIGQNRLYRNNGDGTFSDVTAEAKLNRSDWTTSCAIADLNGDGHPEVYFVNYLQGKDLFTTLCGPNHDQICGPQRFDAANDRLFCNLGDGRFRDVTASSGILKPNGKGLGIVVARFGGADLPNVFVANDMTPNFYFENRTEKPGGPPQFNENGIVLGLALSEEGQEQACMGVAADDADGDGEIDLFVTNFQDQSNAFYSSEGGSFWDVARTNGLRQPSLHNLGFGTQFLDADLDGWPDLIVTNGHIGNFSRDGRSAYQMQPQFFANRGQGRFREPAAGSLGEFFERKLLGRGLARLDWNGDGGEDAVISHLDAPAAVLENTTTTRGGFLVLHLRGVKSNRDAIGTIVEVRTKARTITRQLTAGDGYLSSNQRILVFGLGSAAEVETLTIFWPSGHRDEFPTLPANSRWIAVEGATQLFPAPN